MTLMLWIIWSDSVRSRRPHPLMYFFRVVMFAIVIAVMIHNAWRFPDMYGGAARTLVVLASLVGVLGIVYFLRKLKGAVAERRSRRNATHR